MIEVRGKIKNIEGVKKKIESLGGIFKGYYFYCDIVFAVGYEKVDMGKDVVRLRELKVNNRQTKNYLLTHKIAEWTDRTKTDRFIVRQDFDTMEEARDFIEVHYSGSLKEDFKYCREGWEYWVGNSRVFVEGIEGFGPSVEIESDSKEDLEGLFEKLEIEERFTDSVPDVMRKIIKG